MNPALNPSLLPLRDIHLPGAVLWWPPASGWWALAGLVSVLMVIAWIRYHRGWRHRAAFKALNVVTEQLRNGADCVVCVQRVSEILRRFVMTTAADSKSVAGLTGDGWLQFLDDCWDQTSFTGGSGRLLLKLPYSGSPADRAEALELSRLCVDWVRSQPRGK